VRAKPWFDCNSLSNAKAAKVAFAFAGLLKARDQVDDVGAQILLRDAKVFLAS